MKKIRLRKEVKDYFSERAGAIFFLVVVAIMTFLVTNYTNFEQEKSTNPTSFQTELVQNN
jgi:hypothetical protein